MRPCVVPGCPSTDVTTISHRFPRKAELALRWQRSLGLLNIQLDTLMRRYVVCVEHFAPEDYRNALSKHLNSTAVPCIKGDTSNTYGFHEDTDTGQDEQDDNSTQHVVVMVNSAGCVQPSRTALDAPDQQQSVTLPEDHNFEEYIASEETAAVADNEAYLLHGTDDELHPTEHELLQLELQSDDIAFGLSTAADRSDVGSVLIDLPDELLLSESLNSAGGAVVDLHDIETDAIDAIGDQDSYVYLMEIDMPDCQLEAADTANAESCELRGEAETCQAPESIEPSAAMAHDQQTGEELVCEQQQTTDNTNENAINLLLSAIADGPEVGGGGGGPVAAELGDEDAEEEEDEPYALHDTEEVRLYNEMSKRSLIQLLVAANGRIRDLEQRLETIESAHSKVLGSLELFRSVLKR